MWFLKYNFLYRVIQLLLPEIITKLMAQEDTTDQIYSLFHQTHRSKPTKSFNWHRNDFGYSL